MPMTLLVCVLTWATLSANPREVGAEECTHPGGEVSSRAVLPAGVPASVIAPDESWSRPASAGSGAPEVDAREVRLVVTGATPIIAEPSGASVVHVIIDAASGRRLAALTFGQVRRTLQIQLDGKVILEPRIHSQISGTVLQITGGGGRDWAADLARRIAAPGAVLTARIVD